MAGMVTVRAAFRGGLAQLHGQDIGRCVFSAVSREEACRAARISRPASVASMPHEEGAHCRCLDLDPGVQHSADGQGRIIVHDEVRL